MPGSRFQTLLVDASPRRRRSLGELLAARRGRVLHRARSTSALGLLERVGADLVLVSAALRGYGDVLARAAQSGLEIPLFFRPRAGSGLEDGVPYLGRTRFGSLKFARQLLQSCGTWWELQSSEAPVHERYRKLLNRIGDGLLELGPDDSIRWANAAIRRVVREERLEGMRLEELVEERDVVCLRAVREQQRGGVIAPFLVQLRRGPIVEVDPTPRFGPEGAYLGTSALVHLDSSRTEAELEASRSLVTLYSLASALSQAFGVCDVVHAVLKAARSLGEYAAVGIRWIGEPPRTELREGATLSARLEEAIAGFCDRLAPTQNIRVIKDPEKDPDPAAGIVQLEGYTGLACVPLSAGSLRIGFLWVLATQGESMNREKNSLLISVGAQAGMALENARWVESRLEEEATRRQFYRDALQAVTRGKLILCEYEELEAHWEGCGDLLDSLPLAQKADVPQARQRVEKCMQVQDFLPETIFNMVTCVSEAATNVVKYGPPGRLEVRVDEAAVRLRLDDVGPGIAFANLPRAVLMPGFSTAPSLGLGYSILLELCDRVHLATGEKGTSLVLEAARQAPDPLDAFVGLAGGIPSF